MAVAEMQGSSARQEVSDRLLDAAGISVDRMPLLSVVFDRLGTLCAEGMRHMCTSPLYFSLEGISPGRIGELLDNYDGRALAAVFHAPEWDTRVLIGFDRPFMSTVVEATLGGDGSEPPNVEERPFTNIEVKLAEAAFEQVGKALRASFAGIAETTFNFERTETRMDFAVIGRRNNLSVIAKLKLEALDRGGEMFIIITQTALNPMKQNLARAVSSDMSGRDPRWAKQIQREVQRAEVSLTAVLEERQSTLGEIADFKVGQVLPLQATPRSRVKVECTDQSLFWCELGQADGSYTLRVEDFVDHEQEFIDDILPR